MVCKSDRRTSTVDDVGVVCEARVRVCGSEGRSTQLINTTGGSQRYPI